MVDRTRNVPSKGSDQWIQQEGSVELIALWIETRLPQEMSSGSHCLVSWDPKLEVNPFKATSLLAAVSTSSAEPLLSASGTTAKALAKPPVQLKQNRTDPAILTPRADPVVLTPRASSIDWRHTHDQYVRSRPIAAGELAYVRTKISVLY